MRSALGPGGFVVALVTLCLFPGPGHCLQGSRGACGIAGSAAFTALRCHTSLLGSLSCHRAVGHLNLGATATSAFKHKTDLHASARHRTWLCYLHFCAPEAIMMLWASKQKILTSERTQDAACTFLQFLYTGDFLRCLLTPRPRLFRHTWIALSSV